MPETNHVEDAHTKTKENEEIEKTNNKGINKKKINSPSKYICPNKISKSMRVFL